MSDDPPDRRTEARPGRCATCGRQLEPASESRRASAGTVAVLAESLPVGRCPDGHGARVAGPAVRRAVADAVAEQLPTADGHWLRADTCSRCGARLRMPARRTRQSVTAVFPDGSAPATVTFDVPRTRCTECAADMVPADAAGDLEDAVAALFGD